MRHARWRRLAAVTTIAVALIAVAGVTAGGPSSPPKPHSLQAITAEQSISSLLADIPQSGDTLGQQAAPVTLQWYGDLECPFCREFTLGALPSIIRRWVHSGLLKIEYLSMQTATRSPKVFEAEQLAALAAGMQNRMWNFIEIFYHEQGEEGSDYVTERYLDGLAKQTAGLRLPVWRNARHDPRLAAQVAKERNIVIHDGFSGTPTFLIGHTNGTLYKLKPPSLDQATSFNQAIRELLGPRPGYTTASSGASQFG